MPKCYVVFKADNIQKVENKLEEANPLELLIERGKKGPFFQVRQDICEDLKEAEKIFNESQNTAKVKGRWARSKAPVQESRFLTNALITINCSKEELLKLFEKFEYLSTSKQEKILKENAHLISPQIQLKYETKDLEYQTEIITLKNEIRPNNIALARELSEEVEKIIKILEQEEKKYQGFFGKLGKTIDGELKQDKIKGLKALNENLEKVINQNPPNSEDSDKTVKKIIEEVRKNHSNIDKSIIPLKVSRTASKLNDFIAASEQGLASINLTTAVAPQKK